MPNPNIVQANDPKIFVNACPAIMLANNRIDKLNTLTKYDIVSNIIKNQDITNGAPDGKNTSTNFDLCIDNATMFNPKNEVKLSVKVVNAKLVIVNVYGTMPNILLDNISKNKNIKYEEYPCVLLIASDAIFLNDIFNDSVLFNPRLYTLKYHNVTITNKIIAIAIK